MKCLNCDKIADYYLKEKGGDQYFCAAHLPWFIKLHKDLNVKVFSTAAPAPAPEAVVEEPVVPEINIEPQGTMEETTPEVTTEEPIVTEKKPIKKKA